jgi:hypothetical protein
MITSDNLIWQPVIFKYITQQYIFSIQYNRDDERTTKNLVEHIPDEIGE